jgi:hypothetical protein
MVINVGGCSVLCRFNFIPTNPSGHYHLELASKDDKLVLQRLVQVRYQQPDNNHHTFCMVINVGGCSVL